MKTAVILQNKISQVLLNSGMNLSHAPGAESSRVGIAHHIMIFVGNAYPTDTYVFSPIKPDSYILNPVADAIRRKSKLLTGELDLVIFQKPVKSLEQWTQKYYVWVSVANNYGLSNTGCSLIALISCELTWPHTKPTLSTLFLL